MWRHGVCASEQWHGLRGIGSSPTPQATVWHAAAQEDRAANTHKDYDLDATDIPPTSKKAHMLHDNRGTNGDRDNDSDATDLLKSTNLARTMGEVEAGMPMANPR